jgi:hypothetical protein
MEDELFRAMDMRVDSEQSQQDGGRLRWMKVDSWIVMDRDTDVQAELDGKDSDLEIQGMNALGRGTEAGIHLEVDKHAGEP